MEWQSGNVFIRANKLAKAGDLTAGHTHNFDHTTIIFKGAVRITAKLPNGTEIVREADAPAHFLIRAEVTHEIVATADDTEYWCVYSHRTHQGDVVQDYDGWADAYR
jgi:hypothetical protein